MKTHDLDFIVLPPLTFVDVESQDMCLIYHFLWAPSAKFVFLDFI